MARVLRAGGVAVCGVLTALPWLDERLFPTAWIGMVFWIALTWGEPPHIAFRLWLLGGLMTTATWFYWLPDVAAQRIDVSLFAGWMMALLAAVWDAFRFGVFGFVVAWLKPRGRWGTLVWPAVWVSLEWAWPHVFPWRLGQSQMGWLAVCQIAEVTGVYGVSFLLVWGAACGAAAVRPCWGRFRLPASTREKQPEGWTPTWQAISFALALGGVVVWGHGRMNFFEREAAQRPRLRMAIVQPGSRVDLLATLRRLTRGLDDDADLVLWGEATIDDFSLTLKSFRDAQDVTGQSRFGNEDLRPCPGLGRPLLCGGGSFVGGTNQSGPFRNTAYLIDADETIIGRYHKRVLMPWGEYAVGQQWIPGLRDLLANADPMVPGATAAPLTLHVGETVPDSLRSGDRPAHVKLGVLICYEDLMPGPARETVLEGVEVLVNLNNLAAFRDTPALRQHQQLAKIRAIENRRWLVRCGTTGSSAVISATGQVVEQLPTLTPATAVVDVPLFDGLTLYTRFGDLFAGLCVAASLLLLTLAVRARRRPE